jgi:hypothetical protein
MAADPHTGEPNRRRLGDILHSCGISVGAGINSTWFLRYLFLHPALTNRSLFTARCHSNA